MNAVVKKIIMGFTALVLVFSGAFGAYRYLSANVGVEAETVMDSVAFNEEAVRAFKISGLTYHYTNFIYREDVKSLKLPGLANVKLPGTSTQIGVSYDGKMEIGVDASKMKVDYNGNRINITLPKPEIISHEEVKNSFKVEFDNANVFNNNSVAEFLELFEQEKADMEQRAIDRGLLQEAGSNATEQLINFIYSLPGMDAYNIVVRTA
jgi:hypothetical protein